MSALPSKADMFSVEIDVCYVPIADFDASHVPASRDLSSTGSERPGFVT